MLFKQGRRVGFVGGVVEEQGQHIVYLLDGVNVLQIGELVHHRQPAAELLEASLQSIEMERFEVAFRQRHLLVVSAIEKRQWIRKKYVNLGHVGH